MTEIAQVGIVQRYDEGLREEYRLKEQEVHSDKFYDSSAGSCLRKRILQRGGAAKFSADLQDLRTFKRGNTVHEEWQRMLAKTGEIDLDSEGKMLLEYRLEDETSVGRLDFVSHGLLVDIKTQAERAFKFTRGEGKPKSSHALQVGRYALKLRAKGISVSEARIIYVSRGDFCDAIEYAVPLTEDVLDAAREDQAVENRAWSTYRATCALPLAIAPTNKEDYWQCGWCQFARRCPSANHEKNKYIKAQEAEGGNNHGLEKNGRK